MPSLFTLIGFDPYHFSQCVNGRPDSDERYYSCLSFYNSLYAILKQAKFNGCRKVSKGDIQHVAEYLESKTASMLPERYKKVIEYSKDLFGSYFYSVLLAEIVISGKEARDFLLEHLLCDEEVLERTYLYRWSGFQDISDYELILPQRDIFKLTGNLNSRNSCFYSGNCGRIFTGIAKHEDWDIQMIKVPDLALVNIFAPISWTPERASFLSKYSADFLENDFAQNGIFDIPALEINKAYLANPPNKNSNKFTVLGIPSETQSSKLSYSVSLPGSTFGMLKFVKISGNSSSFFLYRDT
jgi:hypothetical protein